jgi:hypothetical protein
MNIGNDERIEVETDARAQFAGFSRAISWGFSGENFASATRLPSGLE